MSDAQASGVPVKVRRLPFLLAESNPALRNSIANRLGDSGVGDCSAVESGHEAWKLWKQSGRVGVIIAGAKLEEFGGIELLKRVRAEKEAGLQPAFILMSGDDGPRTVDLAMREGADCFALKPFPLGSLNALLEESVAHRKQMAGRDCFLRALEVSADERPIRAIINYQRRREVVDCDMLSGVKWVIRAQHNFGLGTVLELRFVCPPPMEAGCFKPLKGQVTKMERLPPQIGNYLAHLQFIKPPAEEHGIRALLLPGDSP